MRRGMGMGLLSRNFFLEVSGGFLPANRIDVLFTQIVSEKGDCVPAVSHQLQLRLGAVEFFSFYVG